MQGWRKAVGTKMKPLYERYVELKNAAAVAQGYKDQGDLWRAGYNSDTFEQDMLDMYKQLEPMYKELHAYVRRKLSETYGEVSATETNYNLLQFI